MILEAKELCKNFASVDGELRILRGIDLEVDRGEFVAITGASGVGKSTLLHILGGLDTPSSGALTVAGQRVDALGEVQLSEYRNKKCGFVFQYHYLLEEFNAVENVMMPLLVRGESRNNSEATAVRLLDEVGLGHRLHHRPTQLSGGECQRAAVARAMAGAPEILIADEPTGNLDHETAETLHDLLARLNSEKQMTIIVATHDLSLADRASRRFRLSDGHLTEIG
ncbi:MAG: ABC transporter ATP-binding protein [candidate division Zixibacteria bacterium]|nr:ABC transporter ATP-binding protein [candidate division Zixibacteria bacterium]